MRINGALETPISLSEHCSFWMVGLEPGETMTFTRHLREGVRYRCFVMGDAQASDIEFEISDALGRPVARDWETSREALLRFTPKATGTYSLRLTMRQARGLSFCSVLLLPEQGDWLALQKRWSEALSRMQRLFHALEQQGMRVELATRGVCMVGGLVPEGRPVELGYFATSSAVPHLWAVVCDRRARSLRIALRREGDDAAQGSGEGRSVALTVVSEQGVYTPQITVQGDLTEAFVIVAIYTNRGF
ncbi:MAG: hypothetical protein NZM10_02335 [Fimbriimonadales bacterium]|nr:hypothetical protein [Fimbriimonadales bacterium]